MENSQEEFRGVSRKAIEKFIKMRIGYTLHIKTIIMHAITLKFVYCPEEASGYLDQLQYFFENEFLEDVIDIWLGDIDIESIDFSKKEAGEIIITLLSEYRLNDHNNGMTLKNMLQAYSENTLCQRVDGISTIYLDLCVM
jgi:hypothetical protein